MATIALLLIGISPAAATTPASSGATGVQVHSPDDGHDHSAEPHAEKDASDLAILAQFDRPELAAGLEITAQSSMQTVWPVNSQAVVNRAISGNGHDLSVGVGTPVYAIRDGVVTTSRDLNGYESRLSASMQNGYYSYGRYVRIAHVGVSGPFTYAHMSQRLVSEGQQVKAGQIIGYSGNTGYSFGPHLHIDIDAQYIAVRWLRDVGAVLPSQMTRHLPAGSVTKIATGAANATVFGNLTVVDPQASGFTSIYPCNQGAGTANGVPSTSINNYVRGQLNSNFATVRSDSAGAICLYTSAPTHLIWDQVSTSTKVPAVRAERFLDTRSKGAMPDRYTVQKISFGKEHANRTMLGNLTAISGSMSGFSSGFPCSQRAQVLASGGTTSINNFVANEIRPNYAAVKADANGEICFMTNVPAHLIWDQVSSTTAIDGSGSVRVMDTRTSRPLPAGGVLEVKTGKPNTTVLGNLTVAEPATGGFTTPYPCAAGLPRNSKGEIAVSANNYRAGEVNSNFVAVSTDAQGKVCFYSSAPTHLIWDQTGTSSAVRASTAKRLLDSR